MVEPAGTLTATPSRVISIDGTTGEVFVGEVPVVDSLVVRHFEGDESQDDELVKAVARLMDHADSRRRLGVRANADTPEDARRARETAKCRQNPRTAKRQGRMAATVR